MEYIVLVLRSESQTILFSTQRETVKFFYPARCPELQFFFTLFTCFWVKQHSREKWREEYWNQNCEYKLRLCKWVSSCAFFLIKFAFRLQRFYSMIQLCRPCPMFFLLKQLLFSSARKQYEILWGDHNSFFRDPHPLFLEHPVQKQLQMY